MSTPLRDRSIPGTALRPVRRVVTGQWRNLGRALRINSQFAEAFAITANARTDEWVFSFVSTLVAEDFLRHCVHVHPFTMGYLVMQVLGTDDLAAYFADVSSIPIIQQSLRFGREFPVAQLRLLIATSAQHVRDSGLDVIAAIFSLFFGVEFRRRTMQSLRTHQHAMAELFDVYTPDDFVPNCTPPPDGPIIVEVSSGNGASAPAAPMNFSLPPTLNAAVSPAPTGVAAALAGSQGGAPQLDMADVVKAIYALLAPHGNAAPPHLPPVSPAPASSAGGSGNLARSLAAAAATPHATAPRAQRAGAGGPSRAGSSHSLPPRCSASAGTGGGPPPGPPGMTPASCGAPASAGGLPLPPGIPGPHAGTGGAAPPWIPPYSFGFNPHVSPPSHPFAAHSIPPVVHSSPPTAGPTPPLAVNWMGGARCAGLTTANVPDAAAVLRRKPNENNGTQSQHKVTWLRLGEEFNISRVIHSCPEPNDTAAWCDHRPRALESFYGYAAVLSIADDPEAELLGQLRAAATERSMLESPHSHRWRTLSRCSTVLEFVDQLDLLYVDPTDSTQESLWLNADAQASDAYDLFHRLKPLLTTRESKMRARTRLLQRLAAIGDKLTMQQLQSADINNINAWESLLAIARTTDTQFLNVKTSGAASASRADGSHRSRGLNSLVDGASARNLAPGGALQPFAADFSIHAGMSQEEAAATLLQVISARGREQGLQMPRLDPTRTQLYRQLEEMPSGALRELLQSLEQGGASECVVNTVRTFNALRGANKDLENPGGGPRFCWPLEAGYEYLGLTPVPAKVGGINSENCLVCQLLGKKLIDFGQGVQCAPGETYCHGCWRCPNYKAAISAKAAAAGTPADQVAVLLKPIVQPWTTPPRG